MKKFVFLLFIVFATLSISCSDDRGNKLREHLQTDYSLSVKNGKLSSGSKAQYIHLEKSINQAYVKNLDSLINKAFDIQIDKFEDEELGLWSGYMNMFSWLFKSKQSWDDEMNILSNRYFNSLDINQEQYALYEDYLKNIKNIRQQFISSHGLPSYNQIDLPSEKIALNSFSEHTRNNLVIEFGTELFSWFLGFIIVQVVLLFLDRIAGAWGCLIDIVVFIIILIISVIMANSNDSKLINSLREQHTQSVKLDNKSIVESLDENTIRFYENL